MLGGVVYALTGAPQAVYAAGVIGCAGSRRDRYSDRWKDSRQPTEGPDLGSVLAGLHYIRGHRTILGAISLDLFAVLLGGAVALLPVYARDILKTGRGDWACCGAPPLSAPRSWARWWRTGACANTLARSCCGALRSSERPRLSSAVA